MTEKTAQEIIDLLKLNGRKPEHIKNGERVVYLSDAISIVRKALMTDHQPIFAVGEYYVSDDGDIYKIISQENLLISIKMYSKSSGRFLDMTIPSHDPQDKPATAEQIATFKRAEHFASKGRKLDEFRDRDIVKYEGELFFAKTTSEPNLISVSGFDGYGWDDMNADEFDLIQTAEELQEVGESQ